jgi:hypothetical protein
MAKHSNNKSGQDEGAAPPEQLPAAEAAPVESGKNPAAVELGRLGGRKGGPARARKLTQEQRSAIARKAAQTRWAKRQR